MKVTVQLFAAARQLAGTDTLELELPAGATVAELRGKVCEEVPALRSLLSGAMFAINAEYASDETPIDENSEIACIPPVSGG